MLDLRLPAGFFFALLGAILILVGCFASIPPAPLSSVNVNLYSGVMMLVFGIFLLLMAWRAASRRL